MGNKEQIKAKGKIRRDILKWWNKFERPKGPYH